MHKAAQAYLQTQVTTTSQGEIVVLLYDGAIKFLNRAKERLEANDMAGKGNAISKALDVINELDSSLNKEKGGDLAANLHGLYSFCNKQLLMANIKKSSVMIDDVIRVLSGLRNAYAEILTLPEAQAAAQEAAANMQTKSLQSARSNTVSSFGIGAAAMPTPGAGQRVSAMYARAAGSGVMDTANAILESKAVDCNQDGGREPSSAASPTMAGDAGQGSTETAATPLVTGSDEAVSENTAPLFAQKPEADSFAGRLSSLQGGNLYRKYASAQK